MRSVVDGQGLVPDRSLLRRARSRRSAPDRSRRAPSSSPRPGAGVTTFIASARRSDRTSSRLMPASARASRSRRSDSCSRARWLPASRLMITPTKSSRKQRQHLLGARHRQREARLDEEEVVREERPDRPGNGRPRPEPEREDRNGQQVDRGGVVDAEHRLDQRHERRRQCKRADHREGGRAASRSTASLETRPDSMASPSDEDQAVASTRRGCTRSAIQSTTVPCRRRASATASTTLVVGAARTASCTERATRGVGVPFISRTS